MEGYKAFKDAVISVGNVTKRWKDTFSGDTFTLDELLDLGDAYDKMFPVDGWNYFVTFPTGEIGLLSTNDNDIILLMVPEGMKVRPNFCTNCGASLNADSVFCPDCGAKISK